MGLRQEIILNAINALSAKSERRFLIIESDDWGAIRMPSRTVYNQLLSAKLISESDPFAKYDSLASDDDFSQLFDTLVSVKDCKGNHPVITANCVVANPDFEKIKAAHFEHYYCEPIETTYQRYPRHGNAFALWREGMSKKLFQPQYHSREHVNVTAWMPLLRSGNTAFRKAFELQTYALDANIVASLKVHTHEAQDAVNEILRDGYHRFNALFGFSTKSFIAPNYTWNRAVETTLSELGVRLLQGSKRQNFPVTGTERLQYKYHYTGQRNRQGQVYLVRNCLFEPSISTNLDYVSVCLKQIDNAFRWKTPAIVGSHRLNYVGFMDEENRKRNLSGLKKLLTETVKRYPDVEFVSTDMLDDLLFRTK